MPFEHYGWEKALNNIEGDSYGKAIAGSADRQRTRPEVTGVTARRRAEEMGLGRVELPTSRLSGVRSNHLSYRPFRRARKELPAFHHIR
jgi:hypothetical protein